MKVPHAAVAFVVFIATSILTSTVAAQSTPGPLSGETPYGAGPVPGAGLCNDTPLSAQRPISLPADDAPHTGDRNYWEWWYWTGHLEASPKHRGAKTRTTPRRRFSFMVVFEWKPQLHLQQTAYLIGDVARGKTHHGRQGDIPGDPTLVPNGFALQGPHSSAVGGNGRDVLHSEVDGYELDIALKSLKPPLLHFGTGHGSLYCQSVFYYQRQRMAVTGTLKANGVPMRVRGTASFDHQWGLTPAYQVTQSKYLAFTLKDGTDVWLGDVRFPHSPSSAGVTVPDETSAYVKFGSISDRSGNVTILGKDDFELTPTKYFRPSAACAYPVAYDVAIGSRQYHVEPTILDGEVRSTDVPLNYALWAEDATFWDGETSISGDGTGLGWLDLVRACPER